jgi:hypothetical protein
MNIFTLRDLLFKLKWTDDDKNNLSDKYLNLAIHIALEKADLNKDKTSYDFILNTPDTHRRDLLIKHLELTSDIFDYNYF